MANKKKSTNLKTGFVHTVFFWLKNPDNVADKAQLKAGMQSLTAIDVIKTAYIGQPAGTNRAVIDSSYSMSLTFIFDNREDQDIYQTHPIHLAFVDTCAHLWERVVVYDALS
jgi:hypothetical protein